VHEVQQLFEKALGLVAPWKVTRSQFDPEAKRLDLFLDFERGARFLCPDCGAADCPVHDTEDKEWRHLNFMQCPLYLHARVPRIAARRTACARSSSRGRERDAASPSLRGLRHDARQ
jgi:transposase